MHQLTRFLMSHKKDVILDMYSDIHLFMAG